MDIVGNFNSTLTAVAKMVDYFRSNVAGHLSDQSLSKVTKITRVEPLTVVSHDCVNYEHLPVLMDTLSSLYSGFYLQAVAILTRLNNIETVRILDKLTPDRDATGFLLQSKAITESIQLQLAENYIHSLPTRQVMALERQVSGQEPIAGKDIGKQLHEMTNLAVGRLLNVEISAENSAGVVSTYVIPMTVRLSPALLNEESISHIFTHRKEDTGLVERYHAWRAGRISLIKDAIFCQDLIREYRRAAIKDQTGTLQEIVRRVNNSRTFGLLTKNPSLATASNLYLISKNTAKMIEGKTGQSFKTLQGREKILENTYAMIVGVVDPEWDQVTFYYDGIAQPSTFTIRQLKTANGNKGPDIGDIVKSLMVGQAPTF